MSEFTLQYYIFRANSRRKNREDSLTIPLSFVGVVGAQHRETLARLTHTLQAPLITMQIQYASR